MVDWQQPSRSISSTQGFCALTLPTSTYGRVAQPGGGRELWQSAWPTPVKSASCLPRVKLAKTFQVRNLETCQLDFSQGKNGIFFSQNNFFYKKSIFQEGHVLSENPPDWKFRNTFNENLHLLWRQHTRTAKYSLWWFMAGISHTPQHSCIFHSTSRLKVCMAVKTVWFGWTKSNLTRIRQPEEDSLPMRCYAKVPGECIKETKIKI